MLKTKKIFFGFIFFSLLIHVFFSFCFRLEIKQKHQPLIQAWTNLIDSSQLWSLGPKTGLPEGIGLAAADEIRKSYFKQFRPPLDPVYPEIKTIILCRRPRQKLKKEFPVSSQLYFLKEKKPDPKTSTKDIGYKALVSPYGKVLLFYPEKLSPDSKANLTRHDSLRKSAYSFKEKSFWTKFNVKVE